MESADARRSSLSFIVKNLFAYTAGTPNTQKESQQLSPAVSTYGQFEENYISFPPLEDASDDNEPHAGVHAGIRSSNKAIRC